MDITVNRKVTITYDGTEEQYVANAERIHHDFYQRPLDSRDAGDATGAILEFLDAGHDPDDTVFFEDGTVMHFTVEDGKFSYEGNWSNET